jgi:hypothetical protein
VVKYLAFDQVLTVHHVVEEIYIIFINEIKQIVSIICLFKII